MRKDIQINVNSETNQVLRNNEILGISTENLQGKIIFKPEPFVDGTCRMYIENKGSILMNKEEDCYTLDIKSSLLITSGIDICFKITEAENEDGIPIFCTQKMYFKVLDTIDNSGEPPEEYPTWEEILDSKIAELEALEEDVEQAEQERDRKVDEAVENIEDMTEAYNQNAVEKTNEFNTNATNKTTAFDNHVSSKEDEFDTDTDTIVSTKKVELDDYEIAKENELDTHANSIKNDLDDYESAKETELNNYTSTKKTELDTYTNTKKTELDAHEESLESALDSEAEDLISAFNTNATEKTNNFNTNATSKTTDFNDNATQKTTDFNDNAVEKTTEYDTNATEKVDEYNANAEDKIAEYDAHVAELQTEIDELKETVDSELETVTVEGTSIDVSDSAKADGSIAVKGNTSQATSILPEGYTQVEYIEGNGPQYIDTGYLGSDETKIIAEFAYNSRIADNNGYIFGSRISSTNESISATFDSNYFYIGRGNFFIRKKISTNLGEKYKLEIEKTQVKFNDDVIDNSVVSSFVSDYTLYILACNEKGHKIRNTSAKIYNFKIYNNSQLVMNFIPCINPQNEAGLYDLVSNTFFANAGTGSFAAGNEVTIPNPSYPQNIKKVTGDNKIYLTSNNNKFDYKKPYIPGNFSNGTITRDDTVTINIANKVLTITNKSEWRGYISDVIEIEPKNYCKIQWESSSNYVYVGIIEYDSSKKYIKTTATASVHENAVETITTENTKYIRVVFENKNATTVRYSNIQLIIANKFELNLGDVELCKIGNYKDVLFKNEQSSEYYNSNLIENAWYYTPHFKQVIDNANSFQRYACEDDSNKFHYRMALNNDIEMVNFNYKQIAIINYGKVNQTARESGRGNYEGFNVGSRTLYLYTNEDSLLTLEEFKEKWNAKLEKTPLVIIAKSNSSTPIQITDETLIAQLEALHKFRTEHGVNHIWTDAEELEPNLEFTYKQSNLIKRKEHDAKLENIESRLALLE